MQLSMKCSVAAHCLVFIAEAQDAMRVTSTLLAASTGCNPVVIRTVLSALKKAGIISVERGRGGARLARAAADITLYDVYEAVEPDGLDQLIKVHPCSERPCPVAQNIKDVLEEPYRQIEDAIRNTMGSITLESLIESFHVKLSSKGLSPADFEDAAQETDRLQA